MKRIATQTLAFLSLCSISSTTGAVALTGGADGHGGKVVTCYKMENGKKVIDTVELLDLWEGERITPYRQPQKSSASVEEQAEAALERLKNILVGTSVVPPSWDPASIRQLLNSNMDPFLGRPSQVIIDPIHGGKLALTDDASEYVVPDGDTCESSNRP